MSGTTSSKFPKLPKFVQAFVDRHGKARFYLRRAGRKAVALPGPAWSPAFMAAYETALKDQPPIEIGVKRSTPGSIAQLIAAYIGSTGWQELSQGTRSLRLRLLDRFRCAHGDKRVASLDRREMARMLAEVKPSTRGNWITALRGLFEFGSSIGLCDADPTEGVKARYRKTAGFHTWTEEEISKFEAHWPSGSFERLAFSLMLYTGVAMVDALKITRAHVRGGRLYYARQKTGTAVQGLPILPELAHELAEVRDRMIILAGKRGQPLSESRLRAIMSDAYKRAGVPNLPSHGLRKACARRLAEAGATVQEVMAVLGQKSPTMALHYCREAEKAKLAGNAMARLTGERK